MLMYAIQIPVLTIPGYGEKAAEVVCAQLKIQSQNDTEKLKEAKELVYLKGFYEGVMVTGPYAGRKVQEIKKLVQRDLLVAFEGILYQEPEKEVISRQVKFLIVYFILNFNERVLDLFATGAPTSVSLLYAINGTWIMEMQNGKHAHEKPSLVWSCITKKLGEILRQPSTGFKIMLVLENTDWVHDFRGIRLG